ncbi:conserved hypothetical protein [Vibrio coralliirubri]|nr:conserved hypothetical protein [Vibrio coralliirubri]CDT39326.1 conserved hypothetical protein [Vibrio coralliirubri]CDT44799.1 conserved hypothetical protein [Vibrio coralliirubri]CDT82469.1 conserved hypothetical protein [Vibrio coralliirubri]
MFGDGTVLIPIVQQRTQRFVLMHPFMDFRIASHEACAGKKEKRSGWQNGQNYP